MQLWVNCSGKHSPKRVMNQKVDKKNKGGASVLDLALDFYYTRKRFENKIFKWIWSGIIVKPGDQHEGQVRYRNEVLPKLYLCDCGEWFIPNCVLHLSVSILIVLCQDRNLTENQWFDWFLDTDIIIEKQAWLLYRVKLLERIMKQRVTSCNFLF